MNKQENFDAPQKKKNIKILVCHHKKGPYIKNDCVMPIQVGKALHDVSLDYCIGDDTGDNISRKNKSWCELTALYWAWKNLDADYYGLMHYRRYLTFANNSECYPVTSIHHPVLEKSMREENIRNMCTRYDIITGAIWPIHPYALPKLPMTAYDFYKKEHIISDLDIALEEIKRCFPQYCPAAQHEMNATECFFMNLMVLRKDLFHQYCEFLFGVLEEVEKKISLDGRDSYQYRVFGFLAERLANIFVRHCRTNHSDLRIAETGIIFLAEKSTVNIPKIIETHNARIPLPAPSDRINVCMSFDDSYITHGISALLSLLEHTNASIDLYLLCDTSLSTKNRKILKNYVTERHSVTFIDIDPSQLKNLPLNRDHISINTYYRLLLQDLVPVNKIIYLDSDIIVLDDIAKMWEFDIGTHCVAGALDEGGVSQSRRLSLNTDANYINAGIMIFHLQAIKSKFPNPVQTYMTTFQENRDWITLQDQDIINLVYHGDIALLPLRWNMTGRMFNRNEADHKYSSADLQAALDDIGIIHFTDRKKPWKYDCNHPLSFFYWAYRRKIKEFPIGRKEKFVMSIQEHIFYDTDGDMITAGIKNTDLSIQVPKKAAKMTNDIIRRFI